MGKSVNVAVIGCGWAGTRHARAFARHGAVVRWAVDTEPLRAEVLAADHPAARIATDYAEALADPAVTAVASACRTTCTRRSRSRRRRPASMCWSRSRWPTRSTRPTA